MLPRQRGQEEDRALQHADQLQRLARDSRCEISAATSRMRCSICSSVKRTRSIAGGCSVAHAVRRPFRQAVLEDQILEILLVEHLDVDVRIELRAAA